MLDTVELNAFVATVYSLGFIGLFAISLIPFRSWQLFQRHKMLWRTPGVGSSLLVVLILIVCLALYIDASAIEHLFRCLLGFHCGPERASGYYVLSGVGFCYICFELLLLPWSFLARRASPKAT